MDDNQVFKNEEEFLQFIETVKHDTFMQELLGPPGSYPEEDIIKIIRVTLSFYKNKKGWIVIKPEDQLVVMGKIVEWCLRYAIFRACEQGLQDIYFTENNEFVIVNLEEFDDF